MGCLGPSRRYLVDVVLWRKCDRDIGPTRESDASEADMSRVQKTLGADHAVSGDPWLKRRRDSQAKLTGGDAIELAEVIRDSARREWTLPATGTKSQLSPGERALFVKARELLSNEIALVRGVEPAEANAWIDEQLTPTG